MPCMIKADNIKYSYPAHESAPVPALCGVSLEIEQGAFVAIIGENGSGKSTLAKHFNALLLPEEGTVAIKGLDTKIEANLWEIRRQVGMVFQNPDNQLVASIVEEDVAFGPENLGIPPADIRKRVDAALQTVEMDAYAEKALYILSGGQKQRVAIAGILAMHPEVIVLDEPTAMLDPSGRREVMDTVKMLNRQEGKTIVLITHFMEEALQAQRVIVMHEGRIVMDGSPREVFLQAKALELVGMEAPEIVHLADILRSKGIPVKPDVMEVPEMVEEIWQLSQRS
ncbi:MAG: energy-coupling factor transporter ATPase [Bacillota bacterium]|nr:energy-coupling factor transporter ATPase [Bacillota bacterium]